MDIGKKHRFLFIGGLHRSGTSILAKTLASHPDVSAFDETGYPEDEGMYLQTVYPIGNWGGPGRFGFSRWCQFDEGSLMITDQNKECLYNDWFKYWDASKKVLMEKSPQNIIRMRFLKSMFPDSFFLVVVRHPIPVSLATKKWVSPLPLRKLAKQIRGAVLDRRPKKAIDSMRRFTLGSLFEHYVRVHAACQRDIPHLDNIKVVRYEELANTPERTLAMVYNWLDLDPQYAKHGGMIENHDKKYFDEWNYLRQNSVYGAYVSNLIQRYEHKMNHFGYSLQNQPQWDGTASRDL